MFFFLLHEMGTYLKWGIALFMEAKTIYIYRVGWRTSFPLSLYYCCILISRALAFLCACCLVFFISTFIYVIAFPSAILILSVSWFTFWSCFMLWYFCRYFVKKCPVLKQVQYLQNPCSWFEPIPHSTQTFYMVFDVLFIALPLYSLKRYYWTTHTRGIGDLQGKIVYTNTDEIIKL